MVNCNLSTAFIRITIIENMPIDVKTALIEKMLASIHPLQKDIDEGWKVEAEERISEIKTGNVQLISGDEVFCCTAGSPKYCVPPFPSRGRFQQRRGPWLQRPWPLLPLEGAHQVRR